MEQKEMIYKFSIPRNIWLRGEGSDKSFLYRKEDGKQCCLGIFCRSLGFTGDDLYIHTALTDSLIQDINGKLPLFASDIQQKIKDAIPDVYYCAGTVSVEQNMYAVNDTPALPSHRREAVLAELFGLVGIRVEFFDEEIDFHIKSVERTKNEEDSPFDDAYTDGYLGV